MMTRTELDAVISELVRVASYMACENGTVWDVGWMNFPEKPEIFPRSVLAGVIDRLNKERDSDVVMELQDLEGDRELLDHLLGSIYELLNIPKTKDISVVHAEIIRLRSIVPAQQPQQIEMRSFTPEERAAYDHCPVCSKERPPQPPGPPDLPGQYYCLTHRPPR
jgi:hypothetical protein